MRHRHSGRRLGRNSSHRKAMYINMVSSLIEHGRILTTLPKAKELRSFVEKTITWGTSLGELVTMPQDQLTMEQRIRVLHHYRMARRMVPDRILLTRLFREIAPQMLQRPGQGGYTRIIKAGNRRGDNAPMAMIEIIGVQKKAAPVEEKTEEKKD
ncbi:MAG: 50S ribosomal protein L17 [Deltaproteobacteria bacterium HGW-Deltaproteobacteria-17]|nr:MAG: 50S ribosomal protein L17 [Deltaproteobacteria bacterium HGW-Deltaproteobacteria-17]